MVDIISSGKSTNLLSFPSFETKAIYEHVDNESSDFQLFASRKVLVEVKKTGFELLRIKNFNKGACEISSVRRIRIPDLYCVACPKQKKDHIALGLSTGQIKLLDYSTSEFVTKFPADSTRNSVIYLDFDASDEYLSGVFENGFVKIYGLKTKTRLESLEFEYSCTLARFHPTKRFHLALASYEGAVFAYDIQAKKKIFQSIDSHCAPCRDVCMSAVSPDIMLSVGYDCVINIFDTRKRSIQQQIKYCHPLSTIAISDCANFVCVGNLKGDLVSYDLRNTKYPLSAKHVHDSTVTRVAFVPQSDEKANDLCSLEIQSISESKHVSRNLCVSKDSTRKLNRDSFTDFLDLNSFRSREKKSFRMSGNRDSFDLNTMYRKYLDLPGGNINDIQLNPRNSLGESPKRTSMMKNRSHSFDDLMQHESPKLLATKLIYSVEDLSESVEDYQKAKNVESETIGKRKVSTVTELPENSVIEISSTENEKPTSVNEPDCNQKKETNKSNNNDILKEIQNLRNEMNQKFLQLDSELKFNSEKNKWDLLTQNSNLHCKHMDAFENIQELLCYLVQNDAFVNEFIALQKENAELRSEILKLRK